MIKLSRSYKKYPCCKDERSCKNGQRFANKTIRQHDGEIPNGRAYKKLYCSWDICDYKFVAFTKEQQQNYAKYRRK